MEQGSADEGYTKDGAFMSPGRRLLAHFLSTNFIAYAVTCHSRYNVLCHDLRFHPVVCSLLL